jgi:Uncharacterised nucleotidyltransferase
VSIPKVSNEQKILFNLLKGDLPQTLDGIDTARLFDLFRRHRLFPLAAGLLPFLEEQERERWKMAIHRRSIRSMQQLAVLGRISESLETAGISFVSMKGPVLAFELFGNLGDRHSSDLDILVRKGDLQEIMKVLSTTGFMQGYPKTGLSARQWNYYARYKKDVGLFSEKDKLLLEVHYSIENYMGLKDSEVDRFLQHTAELSIGGQPFKIMNRQRNFLYLSFHGAVHQYRRLFWLRDIAEVLKSWDLDHGKVLEDAQKMGSDRMLGLSLVLARELFDAEIPAVYQNYLDANRKVLELLKKISMDMILGREFPTLRQKARHHLFMLRLKPEFRHYLRTLGEIINRHYIGKFLGGH